MLDTNKVIRWYKSCEWGLLHALLDQAMPGQDAGERQDIAFWRASVLAKERRYQEVLDHLEINVSEFTCKTLAYYEIARLLDHIGQPYDALLALYKAPFERELAEYPEIVKDAAFYRVYLATITRNNVDTAIIDELPEDFATRLPTRDHMFGQEVSVGDLRAMIKSK